MKGRFSLSTNGLLVGGTAVLLGVRLLLSLARPGPVVIIDEIGYLTNARVLAGGVPGQMEAAPFYRGGYSLVIVPLVGLLDDPELIYRLVLVVNALLMASLFPLLYLLLRRGFGLAPRHAVWPALVAAAYPTATVTTQAAMSENLLLPLTVVWLVLLGQMLAGRSPGAQAGWAAGAGLCAAALYAAHGRMLVAVGVTGLLLVALALRRRLAWHAAAAGLPALAVGVLAARLLDDFLIERNYGGRDLDEADGRLSALGNLDDALTVAGNVLGHAWYLLVATLGVVLILATGSAGRAISGLTRRDADTPSVLLGVLLVTTVGLVAISALWFYEITRSDMLVYGRYVDVIAPPLLAVGLAMAAEGRVRISARVAIGILLALTAAVAVLRTGLNVPGGESQWQFSGVRHRLEHLPVRWFAEATVVAASATVVLAALVRPLRSRPLAIGGVFVLLILAATALRASIEVPPGGDRWHVLSLPFATDNFVPWAIVGAGLVAAAAATILIALAPRWPRALAPFLLVMFIPTTAYAESFLLERSRSVYPAGWTSPESAAEREGVAVVAYDMSHYELTGQGIYQWFLPNTRMLLFDAGRQPPPARYVISSAVWGREHPDRPAEALWRDTARDQTLWKLGDASNAEGERAPPRDPNSPLDGLTVVPGAIDGFVESVTADDRQIRVSGWAADTRRLRVPDEILVLEGDRLLGAGVLGVEREDLAESYGEPLRRSGFEVTVRTDRGPEAVRSRKLRVFAVLGERASSLRRLP